MYSFVEKEEKYSPFLSVKHYIAGTTDVTWSELQIRGGTEDNSKVIFLSLNENICCDPSLELSQ